MGISLPVLSFLESCLAVFQRFGCGVGHTCLGIWYSVTLSKLSSVSLSRIIPKSGTLSILLGCWEGKRDRIQYWAPRRHSASICNNKYSINRPFLVAALISVPHSGILRLSFLGRTECDEPVERPRACLWL